MKERKQSNLPAGQGESRPASGLDRRSFVRTATVGGAAAAALAAGGMSLPAFGATRNRAPDVTSHNVPTLKDAGAGMYTGMDVMQMISGASIDRNLVTCQVGIVALDFNELLVLSEVVSNLLGIVLGPGDTGPFAMSMYSLSVSSYNVNHAAGTIRAKGIVRSITKIGGVTIENATAPYLSVATDGSRHGQRDSFSINFTTPFWKVPANPLATPSTFHKGWAMFGGDLIIGQISVTK